MFYVKIAKLKFSALLDFMNGKIEFCDFNMKILFFCSLTETLFYDFDEKNAILRYFMKNMMLRFWVRKHSFIVLVGKCDIASLMKNLDFMVW